MLRLLNLPLLAALLCFALGSASAFAELPLLVLSNKQLTRSVEVPASLVLEDPSGNLTAAEVQQRIDREGTRMDGVPRLGYSASAWWLAFRLDAPVAERLDLMIDRPFLDDIEVWLYGGERADAAGGGRTKPAVAGRTLDAQRLAVGCVAQPDSVLPGEIQRVARNAAGVVLPDGGQCGAVQRQHARHHQPAGAAVGVVVGSDGQFGQP